MAKVKEEGVVDPEKIDWTKIDKGEKRVNYETSDEHTIFPYLIYQYLGHPVNRLFLSADNLRHYPCNGIYFADSCFIEVECDDDDEYYATIIKINVGDLRRVTYSSKFISKKYLIDNKYFGFYFTDSLRHVVYNKTVNFERVFQNDTPENRYNIKWLEDFITITNIEDHDELCIYNIQTRSITKSKREIDSIFSNIKKMSGDPDSGLSKLLCNEIDLDPEIQIRCEKYVNYKIAKGEGVPGKGQYDAKGRGKSKNSYYIPPRGYYNQASDNQSFKTKSRDNVHQSLSEDQKKIQDITSNPCFIIEDTNVYKVNDNGAVKKLSLTSPEGKKESLKELKSLLTIIQEKLKLSNTNDGEEPERGKTSSHKETSGKKPRVRPTTTKPGRKVVIDEDSD